MLTKKYSVAPTAPENAKTNLASLECFSSIHKNQLIHSVKTTKILYDMLQMHPPFKYSKITHFVAGSLAAKLIAW